MSHLLKETPETACPSVPVPEGAAQRLLDFLMTQDLPASLNSMAENIWKPLTLDYQSGLSSAFASKNIQVIESFLANLYRGQTVSGFDVPNDATTPFADHLIRAASALGVIHAYAPLQPNDSTYDTEGLLLAMEYVLRARITYPGGGSMRGALVNGRFIPHKLIEAVPIVVAIQRLRFQPRIIMEIGAGAGTIGYLLRQVIDCEYHTVDLPLVSVVHAFLLMSSVGNVWLHGELEAKSSVYVHGLNRPQIQCDLIINKDSLPEFPKSNAIEFLDYIEESLRPRGYFLSINHESHIGGQTRVFDLAAASGLSLIHRSPYWMRDGYVEELWQKL